MNITKNKQIIKIKFNTKMHRLIMEVKKTTLINQNSQHNLT
jgi:hypothetical protein